MYLSSRDTEDLLENPQNGVQNSLVSSLSGAEDLLENPPSRVVDLPEKNTFLNNHLRHSVGIGGPTIGKVTRKPRNNHSDDLYEPPAKKMRMMDGTSADVVSME